MTQTVTPELRQWIADQAKVGADPEVVLKSLLDTGWHREAVIDEMRQIWRGLHEEHPAAQPAPVPVMRVPEPLPEGGIPSALLVDGREVRVIAAMRLPRVVVFGNLLSHEECDALIALARPRMARSDVVSVTTGGSEIHAARTSDGMFFQRGENEICQRIEARLATLLGWPLENGEGLQVLHYRPGAEYKPHYDYFDPKEKGTPSILQRGGQRVATVVMYLNDAKVGGGTTFPDVNFEVAPVKGNAVFFSYDKAHSSSRTLHGGAPVVEGEKWIATKWLREGEFR
ncbi:MAG: 2OG-Fe(II) oxygenase [Pseudomonadales bacterium]|jgi:prolyl 4-hydroxylase|nr:2OG-Fe(II) oxygenase [Pseudomonadales bacterium]